MKDWMITILVTCFIVIILFVIIVILPDDIGNIKNSMLCKGSINSMLCKGSIK